MSVLNKLSLFTYLFHEKNEQRISQGEDLFCSSPEALAMLAALRFLDQ